ncbi:hypothetical protein [Adhaeretor mobilis]|uniref:Uncharacterized protein n=1 Tax=Adhaeretor mobilis TaxID=1930276 RepID=A0A517MZV9_9BACT|nr:hypothetical protein [Adhaeretor mobilis]QDT00416.1 hypothetical protein HG15A2_37520 [Adhaeretor mobilis]
MTNTTPKNPVAKFQDGKVQLAIWKNPSEQGSFYSISAPTRSYQDEAGNYRDTTSLSGTQLLQAQRLLGLAYDRIRDLQDADYAARLAAANEAS